MSVDWHDIYGHLSPYVHTFIPIFVSMDAIGIIPIYTGLTSGMEKHVRRRIAIQAIITAFIIAVAFLFIGKTVFGLLGITVADFQIAGGALLFVIAITDLIVGTKPTRQPGAEMGVVPIGTPIIVGPAVLTVLIMMLDLYGIVPTLVSILMNLGIITIVLLNADRILGLIGESGAKGTAKVISVLLAAIGVMMIRRGIVSIILQFASGKT